jgi:hypothetical protein
LAAIIFVVASIFAMDPADQLSNRGLAVATRLVFVLVMVMKRVFLMTQERPTHARTGADLPDHKPRRKSAKVTRCSRRQRRSSHSSPEKDMM